MATKGLLSDPALSRSMLLPFGKRTYQDYEDDVSEYDELEFALPSAIADPLGLGGLLVKQALTGQRMNPNDATQAMIDIGMLSTPIGLLGGVPKGAVLGANVFQGGPHKYGPEGAAESLKHMSKGEGAQAYGWGRYDAENKAVADDYYNTFNDPEQMPLSFKDKPVDEIWNDGIKERWANEIADMTEGQKDDFTTVMSNLSQVNSIEDVPNVLYGFNKNQMAMYKNIIEPDLIKKPTEAYLYKHDLPDSDIARYLDWDAPLSEQKNILGDESIDEIVARVKASDTPPTETDKMRVLYLQKAARGEDPSGQVLYHDYKSKANQRDPNGADKAASEALAKAGIPGLKYFDGMSRDNPKQVFVNGMPIDSRDIYGNIASDLFVDAGGDFQVAIKNAKSKDAIEVLKDWANDPGMAQITDVGTRNFVTWDQDVLNRMKLLERNGEKFGGLLSR
mgnify:CR=1 FL=1